MKRAAGWIVIFLTVGSAAVAQPREHEEVRSGINFVWGVPLGDFDDNIDEVGLGFLAFAGGRVPGLPLVLGTELGSLNFGSNVILEVTEIAIPVSALNVETNNNMYFGHLLARIQPAVGPVAPYAEGLLGLRYFRGDAKINSDFFLDFGDDLFDLYERRNGLYVLADFEDLAFSYGIGGGIDVDVYKGGTSWDEREATVSLNVGVRYLFGSQAQYLQSNSIRESDGGITFEVSRSRTDLIVPQFGLRVKI